MERLFQLQNNTHEKNIQNFMGIQLLVFIQIWPDYNV